MMDMILLVVNVVLVLALLYTVGELSTLQEEQGEDLDNHEDRLNSLEDYADYLRNELMIIKRRENKDDDRADIYVQWRRRVSRTDAGDRERSA